MTETRFTTGPWKVTGSGDVSVNIEGDPYIRPHIYGHVDVSPRQGIRVLTMYTARDIETAIETLQEILQFKIDNPF